jgi:hypothetical protein
LKQGTPDPGSIHWGFKNRSVNHLDPRPRARNRQLAFRAGGVLETC